MKIDFVHGSDGDWDALYVNDKLYAQGHSIQEHHYIQLLRELGAEVTESDFSFDIFAPANFQEIINGR